jgi:hypothetical protein
MVKLIRDSTASAVDDPKVLSIDIDELCRAAAQEMLAVALAAERLAYLEANARELDATGQRPVAGGGYRGPREATTGAGTVEGRARRVNSRREGGPFAPAILPPHMRRSPKGH